jgi:hypothetical protein
MGTMIIDKILYQLREYMSLFSFVCIIAVGLALEKTIIAYGGFFFLFIWFFTYINLEKWQ